MRSAFFACLLLALSAIVAGLVPHAALAAPATAPFFTTEGSCAPDAILTTSPVSPVAGIELRGAAGGACPPAAQALSRGARIALPSPVRTAHGADGVSFPLLR
jgi:hypothetical protein